MGNSDDNLVSGNEISSTAAEGILLYNGSTQNEMQGNEISGAWWGIVLNGADENKVIKNNISDSATGILFHDSHNNEAMKNEIADLTAEGIFLVVGSSGNKVAKNEISQVWRGIVRIGVNANNLLKNEVADFSDVGIAAWDSSDNLVKKNMVSSAIIRWIDVYDDSAPLPLDNTWEKNEYETANF